MGWFQGLFGKPKPQKKKYTRLTGDERLKLGVARALDEARKHNPARYERLMDRVLEKELGLVDEKQGDPVKKLIDTLRDLRAANLIDDPRSAGQDKWYRDLLEPLGEGLGRAIVSMQQQAMANATSRVEVPAPPAAPAMMIPPPAVAPEPLPSPAEPAMSAESGILIGNLEGKSPEEAASWLINLPHPKMQQLVKAIVDTPDDRIPELLQSLASVSQLAGFVAWLHARPRWLMATIRAIRQQAGASAPAPAKSGGI